MIKHILYVIGLRSPKLSFIYNFVKYSPLKLILILYRVYKLSIKLGEECSGGALPDLYLMANIIFVCRDSYVCL